MCKLLSKTKIESKQSMRVNEQVRKMKKKNCFGIWKVFAILNPNELTKICYIMH